MLGQIVLILANANGLWINLHEFCERILQAARNGDGAAQRHVHIRQFLRGESRRRINRRASLRHDGLGELQVWIILDEIKGEFFSLARGCAVPDRDQIDVVALGEGSKDSHRIVPAALRLVRIDDGGVEHLAGGVNDGHFHAGAKARIKPHRCARASRGCQQQIAQVSGEHFHRIVFSGLEQTHAQIDGERGLDAIAPGVTHAVAQPFVGGATAIRHAEFGCYFCFKRAGRIGRQFGLWLQYKFKRLFLFAAHERENAVRGQFVQRLGEIKIIREFGARRLLAVAHFRDDAPAVPEILAQRADQLRVFGKTLNQNRARALQRSLGRLDGLGRVNERKRCLARVFGRVGDQHVGQRLKAALSRDHRFGATLGFEGKINILQPRLAVGCVDNGAQRVVELALRIYAVNDLRAAVFELAQIAQPLIERAQLRIVQRASDFLAIARDERHG